MKPSRHYTGAVVGIRRTALTRRFYRMYAGGCRRVLLLWNWKRQRWEVDEWPGTEPSLKPCRLTGRHPHGQRWKGETLRNRGA